MHTGGTAASWNPGAVFSYIAKIRTIIFLFKMRSGGAKKLRKLLFSKKIGTFFATQISLLCWDGNNANIVILL